MTEDLQRQLADYETLQDYYEFLDSYFLPLDDDLDALTDDEENRLRLFCTAYWSLSEDSDGFEDVLDSLCNADDTYNACVEVNGGTKSSSRCYRT